MVTIDFETRSKVDVTKVGTYAYAAHPSTDVMCMAWGSEHLPVRIWTPTRPYPFGQGASFIIEAHNVEFEREIWKHVMMRKYGWPEVDEDLSIDGLIGVKHTCPLAGAETRR